MGYTLNHCPSITLLVLFKLMKKKIKQLEKLTTISDNKEKQQRQSWLDAEQQYEDCLRQEAQLENFFQHYAGLGEETLPAVHFQNRQMMLGKIRDAQEHQFSETKRSKIKQEEAFLSWKSQYQEKKCYEKLTEKNKQQWSEQEKKTEQRRLDDLVGQMILRKS